MDQSLLQTQTGFTVFPLLPTELRLLIWWWAVQAIGPRMVYTETFSDAQGTNQNPDETIRPLFLACKESNEEIGHHYRKIFPRLEQSARGILFNPDIDILMCCISGTINRADLSQVQSVAMNRLGWEKWQATFRGLIGGSLPSGLMYLECRILAQIFLKFPNLKQVCYYFTENSELGGESNRKFLDTALKNTLHENLELYVDKEGGIEKQQDEQSENSGVVQSRILALRELQIATTPSKLKELCERWRDVASVKFLSQLKAEHGIK